MHENAGVDSTASDWRAAEFALVFRTVVVCCHRNLGSIAYLELVASHSFQFVDWRQILSHCEIGDRLAG